MGSMYKQQRFHTQHRVNRSIFLPTMCSMTATKESAAIPRWLEDRRSGSESDEPLSPKVGCIGQVKRSNRAVGLSNMSKTSATTQHSKLKKLFSARNFISAAAASLSPAFLAASCRAGGGRGRDADACVWPRRRVCAAPHEIGSSCVRLLDVREMDPPLPVVKKVRKAEEGDGESLWKRRLGVAAVDLTNLDLHPIHHLRHHHLLTRLDRR